MSVRLFFCKSAGGGLFISIEDFSTLCRVPVAGDSRATDLQTPQPIGTKRGFFPKLNPFPTEKI